MKSKKMTVGFIAIDGGETFHTHVIATINRAMPYDNRVGVAEIQS